MAASSSTDAPTLTLLLAGGRGVGKTSVARRLLGAKFTPNCAPTEGIDEFAGALDGDSIKIFDPSHAEIANALEVVRGAACVGVLLVCDPADPDSLRDADGWLLRLRQAVVPEVSLLLAHKHDRARAARRPRSRRVLRAPRRARLARDHRAPRQEHQRRRRDAAAARRAALAAPNRQA